MNQITDIPAYHQMMPQLFQAMKELGGSGTIQEINEKTIEISRIPLEIQQIPHKNGYRSEVEYRLAWARTYLKKVGILDNSARGIWALTEKGQETETIDPNKIVKTVRAMRDLSRKTFSNFALADEPEENDDVPEEIQSWREKLRNILQNLTPDAFERLTQRILRESGFTQVKVTGKAGDGGIDGIGTVKLNGIISFHMLFQCKRYNGSVGSREIRDFRGAMQGRTDKGLFITTGSFSPAAIEEANRPGTTPIDLIDGDELVEKLRELQLGVIPVNDYRVDEKWFLSI